MVAAEEEDLDLELVEMEDLVSLFYELKKEGNNMAPIKSISSGLIGSLVSRIGVSTSIFVRPNLDSTKVVESSFIYSTTGGGYRYHIFTQPGRFYVSNSGSSE